MLLVLLNHYSATIRITPLLFEESPALTITGIWLRSISSIATNCFILISGYYGIRWKARSFCSLIYQILFWLIIVVLVAQALHLSYSKGVVAAIDLFFGSRWFVPAYLTLYILSPVINAYIDKADSRQLGSYLLLFYAFSTVMWWCFRSKEFYSGGSAISLVGIYMLGAYLRHTDLRCFKFTAKSNILICIIISLSLTVGSLLLLKIGIAKNPILRNNPLVIIESIYLFLFFQKLRPREIKVINYVAASVFAVYLMHIHPTLNGYYQDICKYITSRGVEAVVLLPVFILLVFLFAVVIDRLRIISFNSLWKNLSFTKRKQ